MTITVLDMAAAELLLKDGRPCPFEWMMALRTAEPDVKREVYDTANFYRLMHGAGAATVATIDARVQDA